MVDASPNYFDPQVLSELRGLELRSRRVVEGLVAGLHKSPFHGYSVEFAEHREYSPGDDLRHVDWRVYARTDRFYVRRFEEETNFDCYFALDSSESMQYRSEDAALSKYDYAALLTAALGWLVVRQRDSAGLVMFDREITDLLPASAAAARLRQQVETMSRARTEEPSRIGAVLHELARRVRRRAVVIVLSDLFDDVDALIAGMKHLRHRGHDVSLLQIVDPAEQDFTFETPTLFRGLEQSDSHAVDPRSLRKAYLEEFDAFQKQLRFSGRQLGIDQTLARTDALLDHTLTRFLQERQRFASAAR